MNRFLYFFIVLLIFCGCASTKRFYVQGKYDKAIVHAVKKIKANPDKEKEITYLEKSYNAANQRDQERIKFLRTEGRPESWGEVLDLYSALKNRQSVIQPVLPLKLENRSITFPYIDYDKDIQFAKESAAEYWYTKGKQLLNSGDRFQARQAYDYFMNVKYYYSNYQDVDKLITKANQSGVTKVGLMFENNTIFKLSPDFKNNLFNLDLEKLDGKWIRYFPNINDNEKYHYIIKLNLRAIQMTPEKLLQRESVKTKKVQDGTEVLLDKNNNVVKDSLGNPVRVPRMVEVTCKLMETVQQKASHLDGEVTYFEVESQNVITTKPLASDYFFENITYMANGDYRALDEDIKKKLGQPPIPYPNDMEMISGATSLFKKVFSDLLRDNNSLIK